MKLSKRGLGFLKRFEGFRSTPYADVAGKATIGYGHLIKEDESFSLPLSEKDAEALLLKDVEIAERAVNRLIAVSLNTAQFDALVSFTYNLGVGALERSTLLLKVNAKDHFGVPLELLKWHKAGGKQVAGLMRRRCAEAELYFS